jgi:hypothetical protein
MGYVVDFTVGQAFGERQPAGISTTAEFDIAKWALDF